MRKSAFFGGLRFDHYDKEELIDHILTYKSELQRVVTPNVDHVVRVSKKPDLIPLYNDAEISVNDSRILNKVSRIAGKDLGNVIPGSDLTEALMGKIKGSETAVTVIGCGKDSLQIVKEKYDLRNVTHYNPPMGFIDNEEEVNKCIELICSNSPSLVFLALGSPRQEILAGKAKEAGARGTALCIGASLLFLAGEEKRAPEILQKLSLEWLFRLIQSPKRLARRYLIEGPKIFYIMLKEMK